MNKLIVNFSINIRINNSIRMLILFLIIFRKILEILNFKKDKEDRVLKHIKSILNLPQLLLNNLIGKI